MNWQPIKGPVMDRLVDFDWAFKTHSFHSPIQSKLVSNGFLQKAGHMRHRTDLTEQWLTREV